MSLGCSISVESPDTMFVKTRYLSVLVTTMYYYHTTHNDFILKSSSEQTLTSLCQEVSRINC